MQEGRASYASGSIGGLYEYPRTSQKTHARLQRTFFPELPYICLGEQTCRVKGSSGVWEGRDRFCRAGRQGRFKGGQGKADSSSLGGARCKVAGQHCWVVEAGRPQRSRQTEGRTGTATIANGGAAPDKLHAEAFEIQSDSERSQYTVKQRRRSGGCGLAEHGVRVALSHSSGGCGNDQQQRWRGEAGGVMIVKPIALLHSIPEFGELEADARWWSAVSGCGPVTTTLHFTVDN
jgi:hypothetical protein